MKDAEKLVQMLARLYTASTTISKSINSDFILRKRDLLDTYAEVKWRSDDYKRFGASMSNSAGQQQRHGERLGSVPDGETFFLAVHVDEEVSAKRRRCFPLYAGQGWSFIPIEGKLSNARMMCLESLHAQLAKPQSMIETGR